MRSRARPEKALLAPDSGVFRNDISRPCALDSCPSGHRNRVGAYLICDVHLERLKAIAADAGVEFRVEAAA